MERIHKRMSSKFGSHWIKVKFFKEEPELKEYKRLKSVRFCEAVSKAKIHPVLLDKDGISCYGAQYAFGWRSSYQNETIDCRENKSTSQKSPSPLDISEIPRLSRPFNYIGLNLEGESDLVISYLSPKKAMDIIEMYNQGHAVKQLELLCCSTMAVCGCTAVRTYVKDLISISFGCEEARKYGGLQKYELAMGIPKQLYALFMD
jgi:uncharacterized protein (DUF169 family)